MIPTDLSRISHRGSCQGASMQINPESEQNDRKNGRLNATILPHAGELFQQELLTIFSVPSCANAAPLCWASGCYFVYVCIATRVQSCSAICCREDSLAPCLNTKPLQPTWPKRLFEFLPRPSYKLGRKTCKLQMITFLPYSYWYRQH